MLPHSRYIALHIASIMFVFLLVNFLAAVLLGYMENFNYTDSFYVTMSASTLSGYGNPAVQTAGGKWFISFFQLFGFGIFFYGLSVIIVADLDRKIEPPSTLTAYILDRN